MEFKDCKMSGMKKLGDVIWRYYVLSVYDCYVLSKKGGMKVF